MLVSVITPSRNRREFIPRLVKQFQLQDWEEKELIIVATGDLIEDLIPKDPCIRVIRHDEGSIGEALNVGIEAASGEVCVRFDDDDYQAVNRVSAQMVQLMLTGKAVTGMCSILMWAEGRPHAWRVYDRMMHSAGGLLAFSTTYAKLHPFVDGRGIPEDTMFVEEAIRNDEYSTISGLDISVISCHGNHDSGRKDPEIENSIEYLESTDNWFRIDYAKIAHIIEGKPATVTPDPEACPTCGGKGEEVPVMGESYTHLCINGCGVYRVEMENSGG